jgi:hypothetical protein
MNVTVTASGYAEVNARLAALGRNLRPAIRRASKRSGQSTSSMVTKIATNFGLKRKVIKGKRLVTVRPSGDGVIVGLQVKRLPAILFGARQTGPGTTTMTVAGRRQMIAGAFISEMPTGHTGVYKRKGKKRLPLEQMTGPSVPEMLSAAGQSINAVVKHAQDTLDKRLNHEIDRLLAKT